MVELNNVRDKLINSCNILFGNEDITQNQYEMCIKNLDNNSSDLLTRNKKEENIFNEIRSYKSSSSVPLLNSEENRLFSDIRNKTNVSPSLFLKKICDTNLAPNSEEKSDLITLLSNIKQRLYQIIVERNSNKENSDYYRTLNLYNKIDNNRLTKNKINSDIAFLLEKERINTNKANDISFKSKTTGIVVLTLVLIALLVFYLI